MRMCSSPSRLNPFRHLNATLESRLMLLDALVVNKETWTPVADLQHDDFLLYEDGVKQRIAYFSRDALPLSVLLLIDVSGSVRPIIDEIHIAAAEALIRLKETDEVALMAFATGARLLQEFTQDHALVAKRVMEVEKIAAVGSGTLINNAMYEAAKYMHNATRPTDRRVIIMISDNIDSAIPFKGHSRSEALDQLHESGIVVCGILVGGAFHKVMRTYTKVHPVGFLLRRISRAGSVKDYAAKTGGTVVSANGEDIKQAFTTLIDLLRARYTLGYYPSNPASDGKFRKLKIHLANQPEKDRPVTVITRQGYSAKKRPK
jgi:VWFA-related protein